MNKNIYTILGIMLIAISGVSANLCDNALELDENNQTLWTSNPGLFDLNNDGATDLTDLGLFASLRNDDSFCYDLLKYEYIDFVTGSATFRENLDRFNTFEISKNLYTKARVFQYEGTRYYSSVNLFDHVTIYNEDKEKIDTPEGLVIHIEPRTIWSRVLIFSKE